MANPAGRDSEPKTRVSFATLRGALAAATLAALLLGACSDSKTPDSTAIKATSTLQSGQAVVTTTPEKATEPTQPAGRVSDEPVAFQTDDGATIKGHLYTSPGPKQTAVIFAHMYPNDQRAWTAFAKDLAGQGIAALTFDFRGYGESGGAKDPAKADKDLTYALLFLKSRDYPLLYLVGASMGGTAALKVAAAQEVTGVVTVSAPLSFMGLNAQSDIAKIRGRKLFLGSKNESEGGGDAAQQIYTQASEPKTVFVFEGSAHGTDLLQGANAADFKARVTAFVSQR